MKNIISCVVTFIVVLLGSGLATAQEKGSTGKNTSPTAGTTNGQTRALIVGISKYKSSSLNLNYADKDAELFKNYLVKSKIVKEKNVISLLNEKATGMSIHQALKSITDSAKTGDTVYIYFSGHGDVQSEDGVNTGYLLGHDASSERVYAGTGGLLEMEILQRKVNVLASKKVVVNLILDACHSSHIINEEGAQKLSNIASTGFTNINRYLSCLPDQKSYEDKLIGQGFFTYYLIQGLLGVADNLPKDNQLTFNELNQFVMAEVLKASGNKQLSKVEAVNPMAVIHTVKPEELQALLAATKSAQLYTYLAARSVGGGTGIKITNDEKAFIDRFNALLQNGDDGIQQAYALFKDGSYSKYLSAPLQESFKQTLAEALGRKPQEALNSILLGRNEEPSAKYLLQAADMSKQVLSLLDTSDYYYKIFAINNKYLTAYSHIRNRNYRKYNEAEKLLQEALKLQSNSAFVLHGLGLVASYKNNHSAAEAYFKKAIKMIPTWTYPRSSLGNSLRDQGRYKEAIAVFEEVIKMAPQFAAAYNNLANVYQDMAMYNEAENLYKKSMEIDSIDVSQELNNLGLLYKDRGNVQNAEKYYQAAISKDQTYGKPYSNLGYLYAMLEDNRAEDYLKKAVEREPFYADLLTDLAGYYSSSSIKADKEKADAIYNEAILNNPFETRAYAGRGWNLAAENAIKAEKYFLEGVRINPDKPSAYFYLAEWYDKQEKFAYAETNYKQALKLNPYYYMAYKKLSDLYLHNNKADMAEKTLLDAIEYFELSPVIFNDIANFYYAQGKLDKASSYYKESLEMDKDYAKAYGSLAYTALDFGDYETAVDQFKNANSNDAIKFAVSDFGSLFNTQMENLINAAKIEDAKTALGYYLSKLPSHPDLEFTMGKILYLSGDVKATAALEKIDLEKLRVQEKYKYWQLIGWINIDKGTYPEAKKAFINSDAYYATPDMLGMALLAYIEKDNEAVKRFVGKTLQYDSNALDAAKISSRYSKKSAEMITKMITEINSK